MFEGILGKKTNPLLNEADKLSKAGDHKGAIELYDKMIEQEPKGVAYYGFRGREKAKIGDMKGAIADFDKADQLGIPEIPFGTLYHAMALKEMGKMDEALKVLEKKMEENPKCAPYLMITHQNFVQEGK